MERRHAEDRRQLAEDGRRDRGELLDRHGRPVAGPVSRRHERTEQAGDDEADAHRLEHAEQEDRARPSEGLFRVPDAAAHFQVEVEQRRETEQPHHHDELRPGTARQVPDFVDQEHRRVADDDARGHARHRSMEEREVFLPDEAVDEEPEGGADTGDYAPPRPPDESQKALLKEMQRLVAERAADLGLAAETLASKRDLSAEILHGADTSKVLQGWRRQLIGDQLLQML